ncbi:MAG TPA: phosphate ABC transporter permease PstA [Candidatus Bathyarchaeia archaeon]|nr:phosphate ABC transporter permease PstA [Candidatus Bathyarchaeia archaeon]
MSNYSFRKVKDKLAYGLGIACVAIAVIPLLSILVEVVRNGLPAMSWEFLTSTPGAVGQPGGGIAEAIQGTMILVSLACLIGLPLGLFTGIYLSEFGNNKYGKTVRFLNDVLTEFPSIIVGILAYSLIVLYMHRFSVIAGAVALSIIMLPIVARTTEEALKVVPNSIRDAGIALGIRRWRTTLSIVLTTGKSGVLTGVLLSIARVAGETAPLLLTVLGSQLFFSGLDQPIDALPLRAYRYALLPYPYAIQQGWGAALVLILLVLGINVSLRLATRGRLYRRSAV